MHPSPGTEGAAPHRVLIAGGGVAALEALLALRALAGERVAPLLFAPDPVFRYRPLSVTEPFDDTAPRQLELAEIADELGAEFVRDSLAGVDPSAALVRTGEGRELAYDSLLVAVGAQGGTTVPGALSFWDSADRGAFRQVLDELGAGAIRHLAFAVPASIAWPLGLYELALLTAARVHERELAGVKLTLVTPEARPMSVFGEQASAAIARLLADAGVELVLDAVPRRFEAGTLALDGAPAIACDQVVSLPIPEVAPIPGLPQDPRGFIAVDRFGGVLGLERVYAAGDATTFPVKQGGIATQAADAAASAIAADAGAPVDPQPFQPVLRGALLTEWGPRFLRSRTRDLSAAASRSALWWPPAKIAGKYLAPYLSRRAGYEVPAATLQDLDPPPGDDPQRVSEEREDVIEMALASAGTAARWQDYRGALRWLEVAEDLQLYLPREYEQKRRSWQALARRGR